MLRYEEHNKIFIQSYFFYSCYFIVSEFDIFNIEFDLNGLIILNNFITDVCTP